jgi:hypothetical protein
MKQTLTAAGPLAGRLERRNQGIGVWFRNDILDTLTAIDAANWDVAQYIDTPEMRLYRKGYEAAIQAMAAAFGLSYQPRSQRRGQGGDPAAPAES